MGSRYRLRSASDTGKLMDLQRTLSKTLINDEASVRVFDSHAYDSKTDNVVKRRSIGKKYRSFEKLSTIEEKRKEPLINSDGMKETKTKRYVSASVYEKSTNFVGGERRAKLVNPLETSGSLHDQQVSPTKKIITDIAEVDLRCQKSRNISENSLSFHPLSMNPLPKNRQQNEMKDMPGSAGKSKAIYMSMNSSKVSRGTQRRNRKFKHYTVLPPIENNDSESFRSTLQIFHKQEKEARIRQKRINNIQAQAQILKINRIIPPDSRLERKIYVPYKILPPIQQNKKKELDIKTQEVIAVKEPLKDIRFVQLLQTLSKNE